MGMLVTTRCTGCGYDRELLSLGAGMGSFRDKCWMPAPCEECRQVVSIDILAPSSSRPGCGNAVASYATRGHRGGALSWRLPSDEVVSVPEFGNRFPACGASLLGFELRGPFD